jgi:hypothetical protein
VDDQSLHEDIPLAPMMVFHGLHNSSHCGVFALETFRFAAPKETMRFRGVLKIRRERRPEDAVLGDACGVRPPEHHADAGRSDAFGGGGARTHHIPGTPQTRAGRRSASHGLPAAWRARCLQRGRPVPGPRRGEGPVTAPCWPCPRTPLGLAQGPARLRSDRDRTDIRVIVIFDDDRSYVVIARRAGSAPRGSG